MIVGIGTDLVHIPRMQSMFIRYGHKVALRVLHDNELMLFQTTIKPAAFLAKRFAAKEATAKALGTGFSEGLSLRDIMVRNNRQGKPELHFFGQARHLASQLHVDYSMISLTDDGDYALAYVTLVELQKNELSDD